MRQIDIVQWLVWSQLITEWAIYLKQLWADYQGVAMLGGLWWVSKRIKGLINDLGERVTSMEANAKAAADSAESAIFTAQQAANTIIAAMEAYNTGRPGQAAAIEAIEQKAENERAGWEQINDIWGNLKERIQQRIADIPNKTVRQKLSGMDRRNYIDIVMQLEEHGFIWGSPADKLRELARSHQALRFHPQDVTPRQVEKFIEGRQIIDKSRQLAYMTKQEMEAHFASQAQRQDQGKKQAA